MRGAFAVALVLGIAANGCRSCVDDDAPATQQAPKSSGPTMPTGMLMPPLAIGAEAGAGAGAGAASLRVTRGVKAGAWTELQLAKPDDKPDRLDFQHWKDDSRFVSLEAMTLMHEAFARALPGFDLFLPRLFPPAALTKLATELETFASRSSGEIVNSAREIAAFAKLTAAQDQGLWVLGP